jgi:ketosteroid isomerase-like protein
MRSLHVALARRVVLAALLAGAAGAAPLGAQAAASAGVVTVTLPPAVDRVLRDYERAWSAGDAAALAALFAPDGHVLQQNRPAVRGRAYIQAAYTGTSGGPLALAALDYAVGDSTGFIIGVYGGRAGDWAGKFILALRRTRGGPWLIAADIDNPSAPPRRVGPSGGAAAGTPAPPPAAPR